jgi:ATP-dependent exoDNAse (exonuclease V) beta subunit
VAAGTVEACAARVASEVGRLVRSGTVRDRNTGLARAVRPGDVAVLFRSREGHQAYERALEAQGIPAYVYKGLGFFDADEVKDVFALLRYLAEPASDLRASAFLRSRIVRLSDRALADLAPGIADALTGPVPEGIERLDDEDRRVLMLARAGAARWLSLADRVPAAELLDLALADSAYAIELAGSRQNQARENLKKLRDLIRRIQNRGFGTLVRLADYLERLAAGDESNAIVDAVDAVSLMTVHAAKGLEFPVVFLVNVLRGTGGTPPPIRVFGSPDADAPGAVSIATYDGESEEGEREAEAEEAKRLLYVALTRARDALYLAAVVRDGLARPGRGSLGAMLPASLVALFPQAAGVGTGGSLTTWRSAGGRGHQVRVVPGE